MRNVVRRLAVLALLALTPACAAKSSGAGGPRESRDVITYDQIREAGFRNAYEAVEGLRSNWLRPRGSDTLIGTPTEVQVYLNSTRLGGVATLRNVPVGDINYIRHYSGIEASGRWGLGHGQGVIYVSTEPR